MSYATIEDSTLPPLPPEEGPIQVGYFDMAKLHAFLVESMKQYCQSIGVKVVVPGSIILREWIFDREVQR